MQIAVQLDQQTDVGVVGAEVDSASRADVGAVSAVIVTHLELKQASKQEKHTKMSFV